MHLIYCDESGNTGTNLSDSNQPVFLLGALIVPEEQWRTLESGLDEIIKESFPSIDADEFELHGADLSNPRRPHPLRGIAIEDRIRCRDACFSLAREHDLRFTYRAIPKKRFHRWCLENFGAGVQINPHVIAFLLVARVVNEYLRSLPERPNGILISDENKEVARDVEKSVRALRLDSGFLALTQIIEKGFFIESHKSRLLQLADLFTYTARRKEEEALGLRVREIDRSGIDLIEPMITRGEESLQDLLKWWSSTHHTKKGGRG